MDLRHLDITTDLLKLIAEIDEFKGSWKLLKSLSPERLKSLRHVATIESIGSSTRIEGSKLSDEAVEELIGQYVQFAHRSLVAPQMIHRLRTLGDRGGKSLIMERHRRSQRDY